MNTSCTDKTGRRQKKSRRRGKRSGKAGRVRAALNFRIRSKRAPVRHGLSTIKTRLKMSSESKVHHASGIQRIPGFMQARNKETLTFIHILCPNLPFSSGSQGHVRALPSQQRKVTVFVHLTIVTPCGTQTVRARMDKSRCAFRQRKQSVADAAPRRHSSPASFCVEARGPAAVMTRTSIRNVYLDLWSAGRVV